MTKKDLLTDAVEIAQAIEPSNDLSSGEVLDTTGEVVTLDAKKVTTKG